MDAEELEARSRLTVECVHSEVWNRRNLTVIDALYAPSFTTSALPPTFPGTREGFRRWITYYHVAFTDVSLTTLDLLVNGERVATRWVSRGTHTGEYLGVAPTYRTFEVEGISILHLQDGQLVADWSQADVLSMMQQLGILGIADLE